MSRLPMLIPAFTALAALAILAVPARAQAPAAPSGDWQIRQIAQPGAVPYCAAEARFENGLALVVGRTPGGEVNLAIGIPGANLPREAKVPLRLAVDGAVERNLEGIAAEPGLIVVPTGRDDAFYQALRRGNALTVEGPQDKAVFQLRGTAKTLAAVTDCAARLTAGVAGGNGSGAAANRPLLPFPLQAILARAGLTEIQVLDLEKLPPGQRPADYAWRFEGVSGGLKEFQAAPDADFVQLTETYLDALRQRCPGPFEAMPGETSTAGRVAMRTARAICQKDGRRVTVELLLYLTETGIFTVFSHEAEGTDTERAAEIRDRIAQVIRDVAVQEARQPG